jgi:hypothetical protein
MADTKEITKISQHASVNSIVELRKDWVEQSEKERAKVLRKMDWNLLPFISLLYLLSFM